jgi:hypothetical protein
MESLWVCSNDDCEVLLQFAFNQRYEVLSDAS